jgi:hypothetical protein
MVASTYHNPTGFHSFTFFTVVFYTEKISASIRKVQRKIITSGEEFCYAGVARIAD